MLVISSEAEDVHRNCPHVRSEIFAPHADEKGIQWADELSVCHARTLTVGLARSNFSLIGGMLAARLHPPCGSIGVRMSSRGKATLYKAIGASEFFNKSDFHDGPVHAYLLLRWQNSEKVLELLQS